MDPLAALLPYLDTVGTGAFVSLFFIAMLRGWLVTGVQVERLVAAYKNQTEDWKGAHAASEETRRLQSKQIDALTAELAKTTSTIMQALERRAVT